MFVLQHWGKCVKILANFRIFCILNLTLSRIIPPIPPTEQLIGVVVQQIKSFNTNYFQKMLNNFLIKKVFSISY